MDEDIESCEDGANASLFSNSVECTNSINDGVGKNLNVNQNNFKSRGSQRRPHSLSISWNSQSFVDRTDTMSPALKRWFNAVSKICKHDDDIDPWHDFLIDSVKSEKAIRYRYSAIKKKWVQDEIWVKLEMLPFDHGAMRECFRLKKLLTAGLNNNHDWSYSSNYVAKKYINLVSRDVYFEDVKLQMESKLWAEEYNRQNPPKKRYQGHWDLTMMADFCWNLKRECVKKTEGKKSRKRSFLSIDIFQLSIIELIERSNKPLYHIEHYMEGTYLKYNSNSGYVDDSCLRNTPQAFSHFTFERSGHRIIIVDIQGVGDLYTDPQIHTADGLNYGDGNLGLKGMALFFSSHHCNSICHFLGLSEFDMHDSELTDDDLEQEILDNDISGMSIDVPPEEDSCGFSSKSYNEIKKRKRSISFKMSGTVAKDGRTSLCATSPAFLDQLFPAPVDLIRAMSVDSGVQSVSTPFVSQRNFMTMSIADSEDSLSSVISVGNFLQSNSGTNHQQFENKSNLCSAFNSRKLFRRRQRNYSDGSDIDASLVSYEEHLAAYHSMRENQKPSSATHPTNLDQEIGHSILAQVHHELARLHESGRFLKSKQLPGGFLHHQFWSHLLNEKDSPENIFNNNATNHININWEACLFHERHAAQLGCLEAVIVMARYCLNMSGHMLQDCPLPPTQNDIDCGLDYLWRAADSGDRRSMIELANLYRKTENTESKLNEIDMNKTILTIDWYEAVKWYKRAFEAANKPDGQLDSKDAEGRYDSADDLMPPQEILAAMAELYLKGGHGLDRNCQLAGELYSQAAEIATNALQGRQAVKYYELSDIAFSQEESCE